MYRKKVVDRKNLARVISALKGKKRKIVFTNGCFDILHIGHIRYLEEAKKMGDVLIVGLNSDRSVSAIKPGRPVIPEGQRAEVLSALCMVDYISIFDEETPYELIREIGPDVLVKGADWDIKDVVGNDIVREVRTIPFVKGISTTGIIRKIRKLK